MSLAENPRQTNTAAPPWPPMRIMAWAVTATVVVAAAGPTYVRAFLPPDGAYTDFVQEWLSARNYFAGMPIYRDVPSSLAEFMTERHSVEGATPSLSFADPKTGAAIAEMKYNAHPPVAVLLALPFGCLSYPNAHLAWNLVTCGLMLAAAALVVRDLGIPFPWPVVFPAIILLLGNPVLNQIYQGQLNCLLAALVTAAWAADRRGRPALAGVAVGLAGGVKLYPLFLLAYFAFSRRWTGLAAGVATLLVTNGLACAMFGPGAYRDYAAEVVPTVSGQFLTSWGNLSLSGFWLRLAGTEPLRGGIGPDFAPGAARLVALALSLVVTALVARACWRAVTRDEHDRAFALAIVGMLLVSPLTWAHYSLLLLVPLGLAWVRSAPGPALWLLGAVIAVLWLPANFAAQVWLGREQAAMFLDSYHPNLTTAENLALVSTPHYALLGLFLLVLRLPDRGETTSHV